MLVSISRYYVGFAMDTFAKLVVEPTHLKNILVKMGSSSQNRGENKQIFELPPVIYPKLKLYSLYTLYTQLYNPQFCVRKYQKHPYKETSSCSQPLRVSLLHCWTSFLGPFTRESPAGRQSMKNTSLNPIASMYGLGMAPSQ